MQNIEQANNKVERIENDRLPCRGCTKKCKDYHRCNARPWRLTDKELFERKK